MIDAIETLSPMVYLIFHSIHLGLPVVSSMGAGGKTDPQKIHITDISKSNNCQLARIIRKRLARMGIKNGVKVVFSSEEKTKMQFVWRTVKIKDLQLAQFHICRPF